MPETVKFDDIEIGATIPELVRTSITRDNLRDFATASGDHNPIHLDDGAARSTGLPGVIIHGMFNMATLGRLLSNWIPQARVRKFSTRFTAMAFPGDRVTCTGVVTAKSSGDGGNTVELAIAAHNQNGDRLLLGKATVALP